MKAQASSSLILGFPDNRGPARRLASGLGLNYADVEIRSFPDGESLVRLPEPLPPYVILYCSLDQPNRRLIELELAAATALELGAERLTLVAPYLCYMRQDVAFHSGEAVSQRIIGALLSRHFDTLVTVDPHLHRTHELRVAVPVRRAIALSAAPLMADWLAARGGHPLLIGPDEESEQWVNAIAGPSGLAHGVARKRRLGDREVQIDLPPLAVAGRQVVLVDDVVSTGHTLLEAGRRLFEAGAASVSVLATHALFVEDAMAKLEAAGITEVCTTDSIAHSTNGLHLDGLLAAVLRDA
jgi:ribose-phosphate pyrophosphokinase